MSLSCFSMCLLKDSFMAKALWHTEHRYGFSPVWRCMCSRSDFWLKQHFVANRTSATFFTIVCLHVKLFASKAFRTLGADMRSLFGMSLHVCFPMTLNSKTLVTIRTFVRLLPCVDSCMQLQCFAFSKRLVTNRTMEGFFTCVDANVCFQIHRMTETFRAMRAWIWFFTSVSPFVLS